VKQAPRPAIFKWRQTAPEFILCAVCWYLRYSLSLRDVEELLAERGLEADHTTIWRWVQCYGPALEQRLRRQLKPTNKSWRVDETYIRVKGGWCYLYRAIDSTGATIDFLVLALRDAAAAKRLFRQGSQRSIASPASRYQHLSGPPLRLGACRSERGTNLRRRCRHRPVQYLNKHLGAGSSRDQTTSEGQARLSRVPSGPANDCGIRGAAHDPEGVGTLGQRR
jgi:transposase-like protein